jgi:hypothetical protein
MRCVLQCPAHNGLPDTVAATFGWDRDQIQQSKWAFHFPGMCGPNFEWTGWPASVAQDSDMRPRKADQKQT